MPTIGTILVVLLLIVAAAAFGGDSKSPAPPAAARDDAAAKAAFLAAYPVLMHPRCLNCHPVADAPLQGDDSHAHAQNVLRGSDGKGKYALKCSNCHQLENLPGENMPPGVPNWHMPPAHMKMVFESKSAGELCRQFKDPKQNGGHSVEGAIEHLEADPLVRWGWSPGDGRSTPPLSHAEFVHRMHQWLQNGAAWTTLSSVNASLESRKRWASRSIAGRGGRLCYSHRLKVPPSGLSLPEE